MKTCAFFGHRDFDVTTEMTVLETMITELIEYHGVTQFYSGARGRFDMAAASVVWKLKEKYPQIKMTRVFSYIPKDGEEYSLSCFDDSIYLLERRVPPRYAILETNKLLAEKVDYVISAVKYSWGGAAKAVEYARKKGKSVINIPDFEESEVFQEKLKRESAVPQTEEDIAKREQMIKNVIEIIEKEKREKETKKKKIRSFLKKSQKPARKA